MKVSSQTLLLLAHIHCKPTQSTRILARCGYWTLIFRCAQQGSNAVSIAWSNSTGLAPGNFASFPTNSPFFLVKKMTPWHNYSSYAGTTNKAQLQTGLGLSAIAWSIPTAFPMGRIPSPLTLQTSKRGANSCPNAAPWRVSLRASLCHPNAALGIVQTSTGPNFVATEIQSHLKLNGTWDFFHVWWGHKLHQNSPSHSCKWIPRPSHRNHDFAALALWPAPQTMTPPPSTRSWWWWRWGGDHNETSAPTNARPSAIGQPGSVFGKLVEKRQGGINSHFGDSRRSRSWRNNVRVLGEHQAPSSLHQSVKTAVIAMMLPLQRNASRPASAQASKRRFAAIVSHVCSGATARASSHW